MILRTVSIIATVLSTETAVNAQCLFEDVTGPAGLGGYVAHAGDGHGPGAVFTDLDGDGYPDLYLAGAGPTPANRLFVNVPAPGGGRRFEEVLDGGAAGDTGASVGAVAGDYDNDGDVDLYVLNFDEPNVLLRNELAQTGSLLFVDATGTTDPTPGVDDGDHGLGIAYHQGVPLDNSLTAAWADVDRDGDLDLYVGNHNGWSGNPIEGPFDVPGRRDVFYLSNGDGTFCDATMELGLTGFQTADGGHETPAQRFSSTNAVIFADFDNDGWIDLLVTNKVGGPDDRDMLYRNLGGTPRGPWLGFEPVTYTLTPTFGNKSPAAMGVEVADYDNDGDLDIYVTDWSDPDDPEAPGRNDLWTNRLAETGQLGFTHGLEMPAIYSWGAQWQDFDNDGRVDLHVATQVGFADHLYMSFDSGPTEFATLAGVDQVRNARGDLSADFDLDGWLDLLVINLGDGPSVLWANRSAEVTTERDHVQITLVGDPDTAAPYRSSRDAIGARLRLSADLDGDQLVSPGEVQIREVVSGSSNAASTSSLPVEMGMRVARAGALEVLWPSGRRSAFGISSGDHLVIDESTLLIGDVTGNGVVDVEDLVTVTQYWGDCPEGPEVCLDQDGNGVVDIAELLLVILNWG